MKGITELLLVFCVIAAHVALLAAIFVAHDALTEAAACLPQPWPHPASMLVFGLTLYVVYCAFMRAAAVAKIRLDDEG